MNVSSLIWTMLIISEDLADVSLTVASVAHLLVLPPPRDASNAVDSYSCNQML